MSKREYSEDVIKIPLAKTSSDSVKKELAKFINDKPVVKEFLNIYSKASWYDSCVICGEFASGCYCNTTLPAPVNDDIPSYKINHLPEEVIPLPLADNFIEEVQQSIYSYIHNNLAIMEFLHKYTILMSAWWADQCYICGQFPNGCNCDGYYNVKGK